MAAVLRRRPRRHLEIPLDRTWATPHLGGNGDDGVPLAVQAPHCVIACLPDRCTLCGLLRGLRWRGGRRHRDGQGPVGQRNRLSALLGVDSVEGLGMRGQDGFQGFPEILQEMEAIRDLGRLWGALLGAFGIRTRPIPRDHLHAGVRPEPLRHRRGRPVWQQGNGLAALQVDEDRAVGVAFPQRPVVHPQHAGGRCGWLRLAAQQA